MGGRGFESRQKRPKLKDGNIYILGDASFSREKVYPRSKRRAFIGLDLAGLSRACGG